MKFVIGDCVKDKFINRVPCRTGMSKKTTMPNRSSRTTRRSVRRRVLNVGCGDDVYGTDFADLYPSHKGVVKADINEGLPYKENTFDEVYSSNFFEHLRSPYDALLEMRRVTKKGGVVTILTDNASYWIFALDRQAHTGAYESKDHPGDRHYALYTPTHFRNYALAAGMVVKSIDYAEDEVPLPFFKRIVKRTVNRVLRFTPLWRMGYARLRVVLRKP